MATTDIELPPAELADLEKYIIDITVKLYDNRDELIKVLLDIKKASDEAINNFRDLTILITEQLEIIAGDHFIKQCKDLIIEAIQKNPRVIVDGFVKKGYMKTKGLYRKNLILQNEAFFLNNSFSDVADDQPDIVDRLFQFKKFWNKLKPENKTILKYYFITLCCYADKRYINFNKYLLIKKFNETKFKDVFEKFNPII